MPTEVVLRKERLLPSEVVVDFSDEKTVAKLIKRIKEHEYFKDNLEIEMKMKAVKSRFLNEPIDLATGKDPNIEGEFYVVMSEVIDQREIRRRKMLVVGSSEELRRLREEGKMQEYAQLHEKLIRKKETLYLELFDNL